MSANFTFWAAAALLLFAAEAMLPGASLLWFGFAAAAMAVVVLLAPTLAFAWQAALFAVFALVSVGAYWKWYRKSAQRQSDAPLLNRRAEQLVGHVVMLQAPIVAGRGRIQIADAFWQVEGADLPAGARVRVVAADGMTLKVQEV